MYIAVGVILRTPNEETTPFPEAAGMQQGSPHTPVHAAHGPRGALLPQAEAVWQEGCGHRSGPGSSFGQGRSVAAWSRVPLISPEVRGASTIPAVIREAGGTRFLFFPDRQRVVCIMNISAGVTGDRRLSIDLARKGCKNRKFNTRYFN